MLQCCHNRRFLFRGHLRLRPSVGLSGVIMLAYLQLETFRP